MKSNNKDKFFTGKFSDFKATKGWAVGQFMGKRGFPDLETDEVEVCWKIIPKQTEYKFHYHKKGVEITVVISGSYSLIVNGQKLSLKKGDFLVVYPETKLRNLGAEKGAEAIVIKAPSIAGDKYETE